MSAPEPPDSSGSGADPPESPQQPTPGESPQQATPGGSPAPASARRLDPDRAAARAGARPRYRAEPAIDTRRYQWMIGILGLGLVAAFSIYLFVTNGVSTPGIPAGGHLHRFVAPLATSGINRPANADPRCDPRAPNPRALNVCDRRAIVLDFFVTGSSDCVHEVDTLQRVSAEFPRIQFAAVAVRGSLRTTAALARSHHWTIPIAVDEDGRVGEIYGVEICPMVEIARPGGLVVKRLVGDPWQRPVRLAAAVRALDEGGA